MLQIDHIYEFFYKTIFKDFDVWNFPSGVSPNNFDINSIRIFSQRQFLGKKIFFYDQEPFLSEIVTPYLNHYTNHTNYAPTEQEKINLPKIYTQPDLFSYILTVSEKSSLVNKIAQEKKLMLLYYFFHGFAALDWYRGYHALNYNKPVVGHKKDFITFNRLITEDRSYRIYFISQLANHNLLDKGLVSFGVSDDGQHWRDELERNNHSKLSNHARQEIWNVLPDLPERLIIDNEYCPGNYSADIIRNIQHPNIKRVDTGSDYFKDVDAFWHIVTETVFYYDKLHLTEKIFKPIVSKQPFMLLAAPGNLAYLKSYGFKTFDSVIDENYDTIQDPDARVDAVVAQMKWYSELSDNDKLDVMKKLEPIIEHNFHHFYGEFKNIIIDELLTNCKNLFKEIDYKETVDYDIIRKLLLN